MPIIKSAVVPAADLAALRKKITELVAQNAVAMVQQAIDGVREEGQYQAIKYLFEMIGLYPAASQDQSPVQDSPKGREQRGWPASSRRSQSVQTIS